MLNFQMQIAVLKIALTFYAFNSDMVTFIHSHWLKVLRLNHRMWVNYCWIWYVQPYNDTTQINNLKWQKSHYCWTQASFLWENVSAKLKSQTQKSDLCVLNYKMSFEFWIQNDIKIRRNGFKRTEQEKLSVWSATVFSWFECLFLFVLSSLFPRKRGFI